MELAKWMEHSVRGMKKGNPAYFQGKITLITDLLAFIHELEFGGGEDYSGMTDLERAIHRGFLCAGVVNVPRTIIEETAKDCLAQMKSEAGGGQNL